ncbi:MAG: energy-coupling factor ABC transporter ATP-binding protein [Anaerolineales bacterium]
MIKFENVIYSYPGSNKLALSEINLHIPDGQFCGVVGANGAGKSTLCYALSGFVPHFYHGDLQGRVLIDDLDISQATLGELAGRVGLVFQNPFNQISGARFTVREEIAFGLENFGVERIEIEERTDETIELIGLQEIANRSPFELSGGQQQKVAVASVLVMRPKVLVLDEPTAQLDPRGTEELFAVLDRLAEPGKITVIMVEQKLEWLGTFAERIIALHRGKIVLDGKPREVLASEKLNKLGIGRTQYTEVAARISKKRTPTRALPVTLKEARTFFK